jgi:hypothetical protein
MGRCESSRSARGCRSTSRPCTMLPIRTPVWCRSRSPMNLLPPIPGDEKARSRLLQSYSTVTQLAYAPTHALA